MKKYLIFACLIIAILSLSGCGHEHVWKDATCTEPKTCTECKKTEGEALGHKWIEANCTEPKTCERCGATEGEALGHKWIEATCTEPKYCERCWDTEGEALGHTWVDATYDAPKTCSVCGETEGEPLTKKVNKDTSEKIFHDMELSFDTTTWFKSIKSIEVYSDESCIVKVTPNNNNTVIASSVWGCANDYGINTIYVYGNDSGELLTTFEN